MDGAGALTSVGAPASPLPGQSAAAASRRRCRHRTGTALRGKDTYGFADGHESWAELLERGDVDVVSVCGPNFVHREIGTAVAESGRHLWIEKPAGRTAEDTSAIASAVHKAGVVSAAGFNYRNAPAVQVARELVSSGRLGEVETIDVSLLADYSAHPDQALSWRFDPEFSGTGVLGDLASHGFDLALHVGGARAGRISELVADQATFITERPVVTGGRSHFERGRDDGPRGAVGNEDLASALLRFESGARGRSRRRASPWGSSALRRRGAGHEGCVVLGLPQDGRAADLPRPGLPGRGLVDAARQAGRRRAGRVPAGLRGGDGLRRPQGRRVPPARREHQHRGAARRHIDDAVVAAELVDAVVRSVEEKRWVTP